MLKRLIVLAGLMLAVGSIISADVPAPPCDPKCPKWTSVR